jgi:(E)-4-hydroxy-3-methylbut-2-enyl-diphosphate synthase
MTDTATADIEATFRQTVELIEAGSELVRWTINDAAAADAAVVMVRRLRSAGISTPIVGDFHFNGHILLGKNAELSELLDKYRINPGNIGHGRQKDENFAKVIQIAVRYKKAVRIGVNWGSLDQDVVSGIMDSAKDCQTPEQIEELTRDVVIESALESARYAESLGLPRDRIVLSAKLSRVQDMVAVYERLAEATDHVLHLGLTEAGGGLKGIVASTAALSMLLQKGIGDTIRVSLTPEPGYSRTREVEVCREILQSLSQRYFMPSVVSCPGCGRTKSVYFQELAKSIRDHIAGRMAQWRDQYPGVEKLEVAVMGCVVNGPGESKHADIGISLPGASEDPVAPVYIDGEKTATLKGERIREEFIEILERYVKNRFGK